MKHNYTVSARLFLLGIVVLCGMIYNTNNQFMYAQYEKRVIFKKVSDPYVDIEPNDKVLFLYLDDFNDDFDPATCNEKQVLDIIGGTYEPPLTYQYLKRPYEIVPLTAREVPKPVYYREIKDKDGKTSYEECSYAQLLQAKDIDNASHYRAITPKTEETAAVDNTNLTGNVKISYRIQITPGIYYAPHPCFVQDEKGFLYHKGAGKGRSVDAEFGNSVSSLDDFQYVATRELVASDYVYGIRRLFNSQIRSPITSKALIEYVKDAGEFSKTLRKAFGDDDDDEFGLGFGYNGRYYRSYRSGPTPILPYMDYKFDGVKLIDKYTFEINLDKPCAKFLQYLTQYYFSPIPWEADVMYNEFQQNNDYKSFSFDRHPVGTGPYTVGHYSKYSYSWRMDYYKGKFPNKNCESMVLSNRNPHFNRLANSDGNTPPVLNPKTGYGVDKNGNGKVDDGELTFHDLNKNGKYDGIANGEGYYFEDLNNNGKQDSNELWYELPASYRTVYPNVGMPNHSNADLSKILKIREEQKKLLIENEMEDFSKLADQANSEIAILEKQGIDVSQIGDEALGNLLDSGRRLPLIDKILRSEFYSVAQSLGYLANGYVDEMDPEITSDMAMIISDSSKSKLDEDWAKTGLQLEENTDLGIAYWGINMTDKRFGWNERDSVRASDSMRKIRQAMAIAFNAEEWGRKFGSGLSVVPTFGPECVFSKAEYDLMKPNLWIYKSDGKGGYQKRSIDEAKMLLKEAGWEDGKNKDGIQLTIQFDKYKMSSGEEEIDWFRRQFEKIGIKVTTLEEDDSDMPMRESYQLFFSRRHPLIPDIEEFAYVLYGSNYEYYTDEYYDFYRVNRFYYANPEFDMLYDQLSWTTDPADRQKLIESLNEIINFDMPVLSFFTKSSFMTRYPWLQNYKSSTIAMRQRVYQRVDTDMRNRLKEEIKKLYN